MADNGDNDKNKKTGLIVFIVVIVLAVAYAVVTGIIQSRAEDSDYTTWQPSRQTEQRFSQFPFSSRSSKEKSGPRIPKKSKYIAKLHIRGTIEEEGSTYNQSWLLESIDMLKDDDNNIGILLMIDSPGGTVYEADGAYLALMDYKNETQRPVYAYMQSMAASGGYYIACAADYIIANRNTLTGSIGVIAGSSVDLTGLMEKYGIKYTTIHAGRNKNMGNYNEPMTDEQRGIMQSIADEAYDQFVSIVAEARGMSVPAVQELADGRIYTAKQALGNGLVDYIVSQDKEVVPLMEQREFESLGEEPEEVDFDYEEDTSFYNLFMEASAQESALPRSLERALEKTVQGPAYYYDGFFN